LPRRKIIMDELDKKIVALFQKDPTMSQKELAEKIGISQPSISARLRKLKEYGILSPCIGVSYKKAKLHMAKVDIDARDSNSILNIIRKCPYLWNAFLVSGKYNLTLFLIGEDISTLQSIVDSKIRPDPNVKDIDFSIVISPEKDFVLSIEFSVPKAETSPCGAVCSECSQYRTERCLGCPYTPFYKGTVWR